MIVMSIDPGLSGAIAVFDGETLIDIVDTPVHSLVRNNKTKRQISASGLAAIFRDKPGHVIVEKVSAMPGQGVTSMFSFGRSFGVIEGILAAFEIPATYVMPSVWTKGHRPRCRQGRITRTSLRAVSRPPEVFCTGQG